MLKDEVVTQFKRRSCNMAKRSRVGRYEVVLSDYDKAKAIAKAKGITMSEFYQEMHGA